MTDGPADRIGDRIKHITVDLKRYIEKRLELVALNIGEQSARMVAQSTQKIAGFIFIFGALVFLLIALALYLGALLDSRSLGFVIVSVPFLIIGYLFINLKPRSITNKLQSEFEKEFVGILKDDEEKEEKLLPSESQELLKKKDYDV